jgi:hypothetical protein
MVSLPSGPAVSRVGESKYTDGVTAHTVAARQVDTASIQSTAQPGLRPSVSVSVSITILNDLAVRLGPPAGASAYLIAKADFEQQISCNFHPGETGPNCSVRVKPARSDLLVGASQGRCITTADRVCHVDRERRFGVPCLKCSEVDFFQR